MKQLLIVIFLFAITGCQQEKICTDFYQKVPEERMSKMMPRCASSVMGFGAGFALADPLAVNSPSYKKPDVPNQMLIKNASIRFEVKNYDDARRNINTLIKLSNAYVASERETKSYNQLSNTVLIKTPELTFEKLIDSIVCQAKNLDDRSITVQDITEEYTDTDSRLKAKREIEKRYLEILQRASTIKDILEVEQKLGGIREEIESAEGRLKFISHSVTYSTIDLTYYEQKALPPERRTSWLSKSAATFIDGWYGLGEFIITLISIWPFLCALGASVILIVRFIQKKKKRDAERELSNL
jgi:hypothetical protein